MVTCLHKLWRHSLRQTALLAAVFAILAGCDAMPLGQRSAAPTAIAGPDQYSLARAAAEDGNFNAAIAGYQKVLEEYPRGKDGAEVRLEFANVLLYADKPGQVLQVVAQVPEMSRSKELRGRAKILEAIAKHSQVEAYLAGNPAYEPALNRSRGVYQLMVDTYSKYSKYDVEGIIPARLRILRESLARLEIRKMQSERAKGDKATASQRAQYIQLEFGDTDTVRENVQLLNAVALRS